MVFIDGENLTIRGQELAKKREMTLRGGEWWDRDVYMWFPAANPLDAVQEVLFPASRAGGFLTQWPPTRAHYYTSVKGDEPRVASTKEALRRFGFHPSVFKRTSDGRSKGVDITLARDVLSHAYLGNYDLALLIAGDGDYLPLVQDVQHRGRVVAVAFFEEWTNPDLRLTADSFHDLTPIFVQSWRHVLGGGAGVE